jgi:hypothetical protein
MFCFVYKKCFSQDVLHELQINKMKKRNFAPPPLLAGLDPKENNFHMAFFPCFFFVFCCFMMLRFLPY